MRRTGRGYRACIPLVSSVTARSIAMLIGRARPLAHAASNAGPSSPLLDAIQEPGHLGLLDGRSGSTECLSSLSRRRGQQNCG